MTCINVSNTPSTILVSKPETLLSLSAENSPILLQLTQPAVIQIGQEKTSIEIRVDGDCRYMALANMPDFSFYTAGEDIEAFSVVYQGDDEYIYLVDLGIEEQLLLNIKGVLVNSVNTGDRGQVQLNGELYNDAWNWTPELPVYLTSQGTLTQVIPEEWVFMEIGRALTEATILLDLEEPILIVP